MNSSFNLDTLFFTVVDSSFDLFITGSQDSDIIENNPTILQCNLSPTSYSEFVQILTWKLVDPFGYQTDVVSDGVRLAGHIILLLSF